MKKGLQKFLLATTLITASVLPGLANTTQITINATVSDFLSVQLINSSNGSTVSTDNITGSYETLNFGTVDARGLNSGTLTGTKSLAGVSLQKVLLDGSRVVYSTNSPPSSVAGALYYINGSSNTGYSVLTNRAGGTTTNVSVANAGDIRALVDTSTNLPLTTTSTVNLNSIQPTGGSPLVLGSLANNTALPVTIGLYVENTTTAAAHTATLTFTGT